MFRCDLHETDRVRLIAKLDRLIKKDEDQILFVDMGPVEGRAERCWSTLGKPLASIVRRPVVV